MSAGSPHLDLGELLAEVNGEAVSDRVPEHLAACPGCRAEAERWGAVAGGVRHLVAAISPPPWLPGGASDGVVKASSSSRLRAAARAGGKGRLLVAAAAALVLAAGGLSYGLVRGLGGNGNSSVVAAAGVTAVSGCPGLAATAGMLERVTGTSLVLKAPGGAPETVTTSASTKLSREVAGTVSDITDGANVVVFGPGAHGGIAARRIVISALPELSSGPPPPRLRHGHGHPPGHAQKPNSSPPGGRAGGTVADASSGSFTVIMPGGYHLRVTTSSATTVYAQATATLGQLQEGGFVVAAGSVKADGALAAATVEQGAHMPHIQHGNGVVLRPWLGCSPSAVATASLLAAG
jgi:Domain of unknown function (DUF5666)